MRRGRKKELKREGTAVEEKKPMQRQSQSQTTQV
jgi:hypothetical protein